MLTVWYELTSNITCLPEIVQSLPKVLQYVIQSSIESVRVSSANALLLVFQSYAHTNENTVIYALVSEILQVLAEHSPYILTLTDAEISHYLDPSKAISTELSKLVAVKDSDIKITNADRKKDAPRAARRGNFGSDFVEDEEWQEKVKNSLGEYVSLEEKAKQFAEDFETALSTIYGVEMQEDNIKLCQDRLLCGQEHLRHIVEKNIVCENALDCDYSFGEPLTLGPNGLITFE
jgi:hypothetical protein